MQRTLTLIVLIASAHFVGCSQDSENSKAKTRFQFHVVEAFPYAQDDKLVENQMSLFGSVKHGTVHLGDKGVIRCKEGDLTVTVKVIVIAADDDGNPDAEGDHERKVQEASEGASGFIRVEGISQGCEWLGQTVTGVTDA